MDITLGIYKMGVKRWNETSKQKKRCLSNLSSTFQKQFLSLIHLHHFYLCQLTASSSLSSVPWCPSTTWLTSSQWLISKWLPTRSNYCLFVPGIFHLPTTCQPLTTTCWPKFSLKCLLISNHLLSNCKKLWVSVGGCWSSHH